MLNGKTVFIDRDISKKKGNFRAAILIHTVVIPVESNIGPCQLQKAVGLLLDKNETKSQQKDTRIARPNE